MSSPKKSRRATVQATHLEPASGVSPVMDTPLLRKDAPGKPVTTPSKSPGRGVLPDKAGEDEASAWGDRSEGGLGEAWLKDQRPPHW